MLRSIISIVLGVVIGMASMMLMHYLSMLIYPLPEGVPFPPKREHEIKLFYEYIKVAPIVVLWLAILAHATGSFVASIVSTWISQYNKWGTPFVPKYQFLIIGLLFTVLGYMNINSMPHPSWFWVDLLFYIPAAYIGYKLIAKKN